MMAGVPLGEQALHRPPLQIDYLFVRDFENPIFCDRHDLAVHLVVMVFPVDCFGPLYELRRIDHVANAPRMDDRFRVR
jgi:hypothetical protein